jgi:hypothetical protein
MNLTISRILGYKNIVQVFIRQLFCKHDYDLVDKTEIFPVPKERESLLFIRPHVCTKCDKQTSLGSGWYV